MKTALLLLILFFPACLFSQQSCGTDRIVVIKNGQENVETERTGAAGKGGSGFLSRFTDEMKVLNAPYKSQREVDKYTVYLFVMNVGSIGGNHLAGDMPRGSQFGYLFKSGQGEKTLNRTVAHELAHGRFKLCHTFDSDYGKMEYISPNPQLDSLIVLECDKKELFIDDSREKKAFDTFLAKFVTFKVGNNEATSTIKAYSILKGNIKVEIGQLKIESKNYSTSKKVRIIRVKRPGESDYFPFDTSQKARLINEVNSYFKQAFIRFEPDNESYQDTVTIGNSINDLVKDVYNKLPAVQRNPDRYYLFVCSQDNNRTEVGKGKISMNVSILYEQTATTASHELGHNLGLQHVFQNDQDREKGACPVGIRKLNEPYTTKNIMDYIYMGIPDYRRFFLKYQINHLKTH